MGLPGTGDFTYPGEWELYDLEADPDELRNVAHEAAYREVFDDMRARMRRAQLQAQDAPHPNEGGLGG
jgi:hypothetical protein